ncbi:YfiT family bacillithiol transferase [Longimicrobium sp.]|uniref:YfiT family bacillithiol transferase n=1 Tax=Longimicrobium sp. TaxID=2029185 RepID=UPI002E2EEE51|nr:putative metal-dependent hydrolase [Longimicrobium sp.]HEX6041097.1 putative metal-dependent hydrolase [Longimicrobium sp.]
MTMTEGAVDPRFPVGRFRVEGEIGADERAAWIEQIAQTPARLREAVAGLSDAQLDTPYRDGGWTVRQVVHHLPDSHLNAYTRVKLGLTETDPVIKPYDEGAWALLDDSRDTPVEVSLTLLEALHARWVVLLRSLPDDAWSRTVQHPENGRMRLDYVLGLYAWHGRHHVAHVTGLRERMGW